MIVWSGLGCLVPAIVFGMWVIVNVIVDGTYGDGAEAERALGTGIALLISAAAIWYLGNALQKPNRTVIDKETGEELILSGSNHSLFFIPMKYWAIPALAIGAVLLGKSLFGA